MSSNSSNWGTPDHPTAWSFGLILLAAGLAIVVLRIFFGRIDIEVGTK